MFRYKRGIHVSYDRQGYIYFRSRLWRELGEREQEEILNLCVEAGAEYYQAVFEFVTGNAGAETVCREHHISRSTLERAVRKYYERFPI